MHAVELSQKSQKFLEKLDKHIKERIEERLRKLGENPVPSDAKFICRDDADDNEAKEILDKLLTNYQYQKIKVLNLRKAWDRVFTNYSEDGAGKTNYRKKERNRGIHR